MSTDPDPLPERASTILSGAPVFSTEVPSAEPATRPLLEAFREIGRTLEIGRTAETVLAALPLVLPAADRFSLTVVARGGSRVLCRRARGRDARRPGLDDAPPEVLAEGGIVHRVTGSGRSERLAAVAEAASDPDFGAGTASALAVPVLGAGGRRLGALVAGSTRPDAFTGADRVRLRDFAAGAAPALERILFYEAAVEGRRLVSEMGVAGKVLQDLLPHGCPALEGLEVGAVYEPCSQVGGDYYDFIPLAEDRWGIAVADVAGKGIPAALLVAALRASIFSLASSGLALRTIMNRVNRLLYESVGETRYATLFYGVLDVPLRRIIYINAGHQPPVLIRANGQVELIHAGGLPVGLFPGPRYFEQDLQLGAGDLLGLYTDGITESADREGELYGRDRLARLLRRERDVGSRAPDVCSLVLKEARRFRRGAPDDDATVVVLRAR